MRMLGWLGAVFIGAWLVLWLAVKVTFAAVLLCMADTPLFALDFQVLLWA